MRINGVDKTQIYKAWVNKDISPYIPYHIEKANKGTLKNLITAATNYFKQMATLAFNYASSSKEDYGYSSWANSSQSQQTLNKFTTTYQQLQVDIANKVVKQTVRNTALRNIKRALNPSAKSFLKENVLEKCTSIDATLKERMKQIFLEAKANNTDLAGLMRNLKAEFQGVIKDGKIETIANTEFNTAYHFGQNDALEDLDEKLSKSGKKVVRVWQTAGGPNVRESHMELDGEERDMDEEFLPGLMYPCDPNCPDPGEVINCRCTIIVKEVEDK